MSTALPILRAEDGFVFLDKPSGLSVHRGWDASRDTVMHRMRDALGHHVYPVHRLDRATSGVLVLALDPERAGVLAAAFRDGQVDKEYLALVRGTLDGPGRIDHPLAPPEGEGDKVPAQTDYAPVACARDRYTLVRAWPRTGRGHQIRRHFRHLRRPLLGDTTYGDGKENRAMRQGVGLHRLALHALGLALPHPLTGVRVQAQSTLPPDLLEPLVRLGFDRGLLESLAPWPSDG